MGIAAINSAHSEMNHITATATATATETSSPPSSSSSSIGDQHCSDAHAASDNTALSLQFPDDEAEKIEPTSQVGEKQVDEVVSEKPSSDDGFDDFVIIESKPEVKGHKKSKIVFPEISRGIQCVVQKAGLLSARYHVSLVEQSQFVVLIFIPSPLFMLLFFLNSERICDPSLCFDTSW